MFVAGSVFHANTNCMNVQELNCIVFRSNPVVSSSSSSRKTYKLNRVQVEEKALKCWNDVNAEDTASSQVDEATQKVTVASRRWSTWPRVRDSTCTWYRWGEGMTRLSSAASQHTLTMKITRPKFRFWNWTSTHVLNTSWQKVPPIIDPLIWFNHPLVFDRVNPN